MKKIGLIATGILLTVGTAFSQAVQTVHEIKEGETLSGLAKIYGTTVGDIMRFNGMNADSKLFVGEKVRIPEAGVKVVAAGAVTTHVVEKGETLYQLSRKYNVSVSELRDWNNIAGNNIQIGQTLKVSAPGTVASRPVAEQPPSSASSVPDEPVGTIEGEVLPTRSDADQSGLVTTPESSVDDSFGKQRGEAPSQPAAGSSSASEGAFAVSYKSQAGGTELITKGLAGVFKSASGWKDGKYFILMNEVAPGTLVKVQTRGKTIYAKVLWNLGNVKENAGLSYRVSDAAAEALGIQGEQADIIVSFFKGSE